MFFPKQQKAATHIAFQLKEQGVEKVYWALVTESPDQDAWEVDAPIAKLSKFRYGVGLPGRDASTTFQILARGQGATLIEARPRTGRTHQIRVHLEHGGFPIIGDTPYGGAPANRMMLHCRRMAFAARDGRPIQAEALPDKAFFSCCASHSIDLTALIGATTP
jgi:23S rRNA-/tRNA-specific pseudouridylate synthase